jgi:hypothetical protein
MLGMGDGLMYLEGCDEITLNPDLGMMWQDDKSSLV